MLDCVTALLTRCNAGISSTQHEMKRHACFQSDFASIHTGCTHSMREGTSTAQVRPLNGPMAHDFGQQFALPQNVCFELVQFALLRLGDRSDGALEVVC